ncbi:MAG: D-alanyl-D-alanine carboxypeptidase family protein [Eubacteriales bacterium]|nr:D-alanyl-D-alanine carboxypeptidase family protein [Eubacteriales bacterium]
MKKWKSVAGLLLALSLGLGSLPGQTAVFAEEDENYEESYDNYEEEYVETEANAEESGEGSQEHVSSYYDEIATNAIPGWPQSDRFDADAAIVMDAQTGAVLVGKNIEKTEYPASITKIMTTLLALENGNLKDTVTFSENAVYSIEPGSSHLGLTEGEKLSLEDCLYGIMLASANEISNAVAEHIGGSVENFAEMMNARAAELGCTNTHFVNPHGLHDENHYVCAKDMALIMQAALKIDKFREIIGTTEYHFEETNLVKEKRYFLNHHKMIQDNEEGLLYEGCLGGKTGFTDDAWNTLVTADERDGMELIVVVLRVNGLYESYAETKQLLDFAFANFTKSTVTNAEAVTSGVEFTGISDEEELKKVQTADLTKQPFTLAETTDVTLPNGVTADKLTKTMDFAAGTLNYSYEGQVLGSSSFEYTGVWNIEPETQPQTTVESESESETAAVLTVKKSAPSWAAEGTVPGKIYRFFAVIGGAVGIGYGYMDRFIKAHTLIAVLIGAVLLLVFIPMLFVNRSRSRKYRHIMELREEEMQTRRRLEREIEEKSAAQIEAELRAYELESRLKAERKRQQNPEKGEAAEQEAVEAEVQSTAAEANAEQPVFERIQEEEKVGSVKTPENDGGRMWSSEAEPTDAEDEFQDEFIEISVDETGK